MAGTLSDSVVSTETTPKLASKDDHHRLPEEATDINRTSAFMIGMLVNHLASAFAAVDFRFYR